MPLCDSYSLPGIGHTDVSNYSPMGKLIVVFSLVLVSLNWIFYTFHHALEVMCILGWSLSFISLIIEAFYFGHLMRRTDSFEKTMMLRKIEGGGIKGWQRMRWLDGITDSNDMSLTKFGIVDGQGGLACCCPQGHNWTELRSMLHNPKCSSRWQGHNFTIHRNKYWIPIQ